METGFAKPSMAMVVSNEVLLCDCLNVATFFVLHDSIKGAQQDVATPAEMLERK
jgi:hypothetical protein